MVPETATSAEFGKYCSRPVQDLGSRGTGAGHYEKGARSWPRRSKPVQLGQT